MLIGVPAETAPGETRVAVTTETAKKLVAQGHSVRVQSGAGLSASLTDAAYQAAGAEITDQAGAFGADVVLKVRSPNDPEIALMKTGTVVIGMLNPFDASGLQRLETASDVREPTELLLLPGVDVAHDERVEPSSGHDGEAFAVHHADVDPLGLALQPDADGLRDVPRSTASSAPPDPRVRPRCATNRPARTRTGRR